ncbi:MAG: DMT family transporter [Elainellaceae cyanobacterium]
MILRWRAAAILGCGILCISTSALFIRMALGAADASGLGFSLVISASRLFLASVILLPTWRRFQPDAYRPGTLVYSAIAGVLLAVHFGTWITSLSYTSIAASTVLVTTDPIWVALISWLWLGERLTRRIILGIAVTLVGGLVIGWQVGGEAVGQNPLLGNALALVGAWTFSLYFVLGREVQRQGLKAGQHSAIAFSAAALVLLPLPLLVGAPYTGYPSSVYGLLLLMAIVPQLMGHTSLNWAAYHLSPTLVTLAILLEPVGASTLGYFAFGEVPSVRVLVGAVIILAGVAIAATETKSRA